MNISVRKQNLFLTSLVWPVWYQFRRDCWLFEIESYSHFIYLLKLMHSFHLLSVILPISLSSKSFSLRLCGHPSHHFKDSERFHPLFGSALNSKSCWALHISKGETMWKSRHMRLPCQLASVYLRMFLAVKQVSGLLSLWNSKQMMRHLSVRPKGRKETRITFNNFVFLMSDNVSFFAFTLSHCYL